MSFCFYYGKIILCLERVKQMKNKLKSIKKPLISLIALAIVFVILNYFFLVPLNIRLGGIWFFIAMILIITSSLSMTKGFTNKNKLNEFDVKKVSKYAVLKIGMGVVIIIVYLFLAFFSSSIFNAEKYYKLIGDIPEAIEFTSDFDAVDTDSNLPIIDSELAEQLGDKEFGKFGSLGSEFHVGEFHDLSVNGNLVAVAPLEYNGLFKWLNNEAGTPGYVTVDKTTGEVEVINDLNLKYMPSAYFSKDLHRHLYQNGGNKYKLIDFALELDDEFNPYWVINALDPTIGVSGGEQVVGVYIVNPKDGEITFYKTSEVPSWVDTVYPKEFVIEQLNYWGSLENGFFNSIFAQKNVLQTTDGSRRVYNDNEVYHYTGLTSASSDEATVGFVFVNTKTKEVIRYNMSGATETAAMESAEGIVQNFGYHATFPIPMNVYNEPTFLITLKDNKGLIKQYAFVNVSDFAVVGLGDSIDKAYANYGEKLNVDNTIDYDQNDIVTVRGLVERINMSVVDGTSQYEILINGTLYTARYKSSPYLSITQINDDVILKLIGDTVLEFHNVTIEGEVE
jgi:hypothetical protein